MRKLLLIASIALSTNAAAPLGKPLFDLLQGIESGDAELVGKAIKQTPSVLHVRLGVYGDTPLMAAIRKYGQDLSAQHEKPSRLTLKALLGGLACGFFANELVIQLHGAERHALFAGVMTTILSTFYFASKGSGNRAQVIALLLQYDPHPHARNREGLNALELLRAYHHYARELNETSWFHFHSFLQQAERGSPEE